MFTARGTDTTMVVNSPLDLNQRAADISPLYAVEVLITQPEIAIVLDERVVVPGMWPAKPCRFLFDAELKDGISGKTHRRWM